MDNLKLGSRIRLLRKQARLTQEILCARAGFSKKVIQDIEAGTGNPTLESLKSIAQVLGVEFTDLFGEASPAAHASRPELIGAIVSALTGLEDEDLRTTLDFVGHFALERASSKEDAG